MAALTARPKTCLGFALLAVLQTTTSAQLSNNADLEGIFLKMEEDVIALRLEVERVYTQARCSSQTLKGCIKGNYDDCFSEFPNPTCPSKEVSFAQIGSCSTSNKETNACGSGLFDYTVPSVIIPGVLTNGRDGNPEDKKVIETICYSRQLDPWFVNKHKEDNEFWGAAGIEDPSFFFGSQDGIFRIFPGRHSKVCGVYDHRVRPWYNAASSGPKNIVMVLDTSGSMEGKLLDLLKLAARRVINTLSFGDKVSVVQFSTDARLHAGAQDRMLTATAENKKYLLDIIDRFEAFGGTNFYDAFVKAFDSLEATVVVELANDCNTAILFMTDGIMSGPVRIPEEDRPAAVLQLVGKRLGEMQQNHPIILFTYSVGDSVGDVHAFPKQLACSTEGGVWSKIVDETKLAESLASYSSLFSLGLGDNENENFTAWIEPYIYSTGGVTGTTISAPVYDRSRVPHLFIGVVGFDITISAIERLGNANAKEILSRLVDGSRAKCHSLEVTPCVLESFRRRGSAGDNALCFPGNCTESDFVQIEPEICSTLSDLPSNVFDNGNFSDKTSYEEKVCCLQGENERTTECPAPSTGTSSNITIIAVAVGVVAFVGLCFFIWFVKRRMAKEGYICRQHEGKKPEQIHEVSQEIAHGDVLAMPPPSRNPNARSSAPLASLDKP